MNFLNLHHVNLIMFTAFFFVITYFTNKIFSKILISKKIYDINEKSKNNLVYTGFGLSFVFITVFFLILGGKSGLFNSIFNVRFIN